jgi:hypothetical protein
MQNVRLPSGLAQECTQPSNVFFALVSALTSANRRCLSFRFESTRGGEG